MSNVCNGCERSIKDGGFYMECYNCGKFYHLLCVNMSKESYNKLNDENKATWHCPTCVCSRPKGDNSSTPVGSPAPRGPFDDTFTKTISYVNKKRGTQGPKVSAVIPSEAREEDLRKGDVSLLFSEIRSLRQEILELKENNLRLNEQISSFQQVLNNTLSDHSKKLENAEREILELRSTVDSLCQASNQKDQELLRSELEIVGVPEVNNENACHLAMVAVNKLGIGLLEEDIDDVKRVGLKPVKSSQVTNKMPRPIVLRLLRGRKRDEIIKAAKTRRNMTSEGIVDGTPSNIYFNERLTKQNRQLFRSARERAKDRDYRYCWVQNGHICIRRSDGSPAIRITSLLDLDLKIVPKKPEYMGVDNNSRNEST